ncbi:PARP catalytic domain-containing protein [Mycena sanguinolenta]|uniref:PARP catalytic domain-containing protein n=1 Tax=Mycena sanguinolenta TaxID=230812 RepID=A0A8H6XUC3_9AGAR|nr:PARP catalytic domain-containing protein [Mycena sanguinolenta]
MTLPEADSYFDGPESPFRVVLVNRVVIGNPLIRGHSAEEITEPPYGYDSGSPAQTSTTMKPSSTATTPSAPAYLIVYGEDVDSSHADSSFSNASHDFFVIIEEYLGYHYDAYSGYHYAAYHDEAYSSYGNRYRYH